MLLVEAEKHYRQGCHQAVSILNQRTEAPTPFMLAVEREFFEWRFNDGPERTIHHVFETARNKANGTAD